MKIKTTMSGKLLIFIEKCSIDRDCIYFIMFMQIVTKDIKNFVHEVLSRNLKNTRDIG